MTDREKLIELLLLADPNPYECEEQSGSCELTTCTQCRAENTANILLSNGVVVRDKGEWIPVKDNTIMSPCYECSVCGRRINTFGTPQVCVPFCHCGADLRGEQREP